MQSKNLTGTHNTVTRPLKGEVGATSSTVRDVKSKTLYSKFLQKEDNREIFLLEYKTNRVNV